MSHLLESAIGMRRRAACVVNDTRTAFGVEHTRSIVALGNHRVAQNDEPEPALADAPRTMRDIEADGQAIARAVMRENRRPVPHLQPASEPRS